MSYKKDFLVNVDPGSLLLKAPSYSVLLYVMIITVAFKEHGCERTIALIAREEGDTERWRDNV
jgi:hypothetical protein